MGTGSEEADALDKIIQDGIRREVERMQAEAARKAAEEAAKAQGQNNMAADGPATVGWPDNEVQAAPQTGVDRVAGALGVGHAGDVAFARNLLNNGQAPLGSVSRPEESSAGAKESTAGSRSAKPALGLG